MNKAAAALVISAGQRESLTVLARSRTAAHREAQRAKVLLMAADGVANSQIAAKVGVTPVTVRPAWRATTTPRSGRKRHCGGMMSG
jgi:DNA-binding NarL/FixJ family response regulator